MTTYPSTNLRLTYDDAADTWSYTEQSYEYTNPTPPTWQGYTTPDPEFQPAPEQDDAQDDDRDPCPEGYIYDEVLKQCVPDPNYNTRAWMGEPQGGGNAQPDPEYIDFRDMCYNDMVQFGKDKGYFNAAGTFIGAGKAHPLTGIWGQFGLDSQANRFAINFAKKGGKVWNPNLPFIGNLYDPVQAGQTDDLAKLIAGVDTWSNYANNINVHSDVEDIGKSEITSVTGKSFDEIQNEIATKKAQKKAEKKQAEADIAAMEVMEKGQQYTDDKGDTYTKVTDNQTGGGGSQGYTFTPKVD